jgi:hypothetical protein
MSDDSPAGIGRRVSGGARPARDAGRPWIAWWSRVHKPLTLAFALCLAGLGSAGFALQPASSGPPPISGDHLGGWTTSIDPFPTSNFAVGVSVGACGPLPASRPKLSAFPCGNDTHNVTRMQLRTVGVYTGQIGRVHVLAALLGLGPGLCPRPGVYKYPSCFFKADVTLRDHILDYSLLLTLPDGIFYAKAGSYANAAIPGVLVAGPVTIFQEMDLQESSSPSQISLLAGHAPTVTAPFEWSWKTTGGAARGVAFTLTDIAGVQSDSKKAFISGIFLGVAGAALIGLMEQLLRPLGSPGKDDPAPETSAGRPGKTGRPKKRRWHVPVEQPTARARSRRS